MKKDRFERHFDFLIHDVARLMRYAVDAKVAMLGLTRSQWWLLAYLQRDEGKTQRELAEDMDVGQASLGALIDRVEKKGWITRRPHATDRRAKVIYFTPAGRAIIEKVNTLGTELRNRNLGCLSAREQDQLIDLLLHVKDSAAESYRAALQSGNSSASTEPSSGST